MQAIDNFIDVLADRYGSFDIVIGRLFMGPFLRGAICAELVLDERGRLPVDIATPDPASIRFRRKADPVLGQVWQPGQWQLDFKPLDIPTFRYVPIDPLPASPYGRPLAAPALFTSVFLLGMLHDLKRVIQQQGYPRIDISIDIDKILEIAPHLAANPAEFDAWAADLVAQVEAAYSRLKPDDAYIHTANMTVNKPVGAADASSLGGIDGVIKALERMAVRALKTMPLLMGITDAVGDVQSNRQWEIHIAGIKSIQHYTETMLARLFTLALEAQGIQADVEFEFSEVRAAEELRDAQTEAMKIANEKAKVDAGWISQDEAAEEITGHPATGTVAPLPGAQPQIVQDDGSGNEQLNNPSNNSTQVHKRVKLVPDGADEPLTPVPQEVVISDSDVERAVKDWDTLMSDYAGMLDAVVIGANHHDGTDGRHTAIRASDPSPWTYDQTSHRYRRTSNGQYIGQAKMVELRDAFVDAKRSVAGDLAKQIGKGDITVQQWEMELRKQVKTAFVDEYVLGKGGRNAMTQSDWGKVGNMVKDQYAYAHQFARDIADGKLSQAQIEARSNLYFNAATEAFERGQAASYGLPTLPAYPSDGQAPCKTNCRCAWQIDETDTEWQCTWVLHAAESCSGCLENAAKWSPLVIQKAGRSRQQLEQHLERVMNGHQ